jgi:hypothetical protein
MEQEMRDRIMDMISESEDGDAIEELTDLQHTGYLTDDTGFFMAVDGRKYIIRVQEV